VTTLVYLYAVLSHSVDAPVEGIDGARVRWIVHDGLAAAVSDVASEDFEDMTWLGPRAISHQDVNASLFEASEAIVPLAFGTVFRDDDRVRQLLLDEVPASSTMRRCA